jgi:regulator of replication initiation timing
MLDSTFIIENLHDMSLVEKRIVELYQGEKGRCSLLNTTSYLKFRLAALYKDNETLQLNRDKLKITLQGAVVNIFYTMDDIELPKEETDSTEHHHHHKKRKKPHVSRD